MSLYGTKEYYEEELAAAESRLELLIYAVVKKTANMEGKPKEADKLNAICRAYTQAYEDTCEARRRYNEHCNNESGS